MRGVFRATMVFGLASAVLAGPAGAQTAGRGTGLALGGFNLLASPEVQKELKLDDAQAKKANDLAGAMNQRYQVDIGKLKGLNQDERMKRLPSLAGPHYEEGMRSLRGFLRPEQVDRFDQILFQQRLPMAMLEPNIAKTLRLTNEQAQQVATIQADAQNQSRAAIQGAKTDPKAALPRLREIARESTNKAVGLLTEDQMKTWEKLTGPPFDPQAEGGK